MYKTFYGIIYLAGLCLLLGIGCGKSYYGKPRESPWNQYVNINRGNLGTYKVYEFVHNNRTYKIYPYKIKFSSEFALDPRTAEGFGAEIKKLTFTSDSEINKAIIIRHFKNNFNLKIQVI